MATNIVIADANTTPVSHTFIPIGLNADGEFVWMDQSQSNPLGYWRVRLSIKRPPPARAGQSSSGRSYRVRIELEEPILATLSNSTVSGVLPAPTLAYTPRSIQEYILPEEGTVLDRQNISKMAPLLAQNAQIKAVVETLTAPGL